MPPLRHMTRVCIAGLIGSLFLIAAGIATGAAQAPDHAMYRYAYVVSETRNTLTLYAIDPRHPADAVPVYGLALPPGSQPPFSGAASPDGRWVALTFQRRGVPRADLIVFEAASGRIARWAPFGIVERRNILEGPPPIAWSPDSRYLAYTSFVPWVFLGYRSDVFLIDMEAPVTAPPINLSADQARQAHIGWSADSSRLAVARWDCSASRCRLGLDVYEAESAARIDALEIDTRVPGERWMDYVCQIAWSPDGAHISYVTHCERPPRGIREAYVIETATGRLTQLTDSAPRMMRGDRVIAFSAEHVPQWIADDTLLIGSAVNGFITEADGFPRIIRTNGITAYRLSDGALAGPPLTLSPNVAQEWALSPADARLALRVRELTPDGNPIGASVQIATLDGETLEVQARGPAGCDNLAWSPDGAWLAYRDLAQYCWDQPQITLMDAISGAAAPHQLLQTSTERVLWLGWLALPDVRP